MICKNLPENYVFYEYYVLQKLLYCDIIHAESPYLKSGETSFERIFEKSVGVYQSEPAYAFNVLLAHPYVYILYAV